MNRPLSAAIVIAALVSSPALAQQTQQKAAATGAQLFNQTCTVCHLPPGGGAQAAPRLSKNSMGGSEPGLRVIIANGTPNGMPAFKSQFTESEINAIAAYDKTMN